MKLYCNWLTLLLAVAVVCVAVPAQASLVTFQVFNGSYGLSTDGFGSTSNTGNITASVPVGATVAGAWLYSATFDPSTPSVTFQGSNLTFGPKVTNPDNGLGNARADVTSIVAPIVNGGPGGVYTFSVQENASAASGTDGEALVVVYNLPSLPNQTVGILDGFSAVHGDDASINFSAPLDPTQAGFVADMRLGDSFSCCGQSSTITVNGTVITNNAGNNDDSKDATPVNGNLITVGGWNDPFSPFLPSYAADHERYDLTPEITKGDTSIHVHTVNPSTDDNIFLETFLVSGTATVVSNVPEPSTLPVIALGGGIVLLWRIRRKKPASRVA